MGCDIHMMVEKKVKTKKHGEVWATVNTLNAVYPDGLVQVDKLNDSPYGHFYRIEMRNYNFFADIACVRGDGEYRDRGLPHDVAPLTLEFAESWGLDAHSSSYLYADEMIPLYIKHHLSDEEKAKLVSDRMSGGLSDIQVFHLIMERHFNIATREEDNPQDYRFVFVFDN